MKILNTNIKENKILNEQDEELEKLHKNVKNILYVSKQMYNEVVEQNIIVDRFDNEVDKTIVNVKKTDNKTNKLLDDNNACCCNIV